MKSFSPKSLIFVVFVVLLFLNIFFFLRFQNSLLEQVESREEILSLPFFPNRENYKQRRGEVISYENFSAHLEAYFSQFILSSKNRVSTKEVSRFLDRKKKEVERSFQERQVAFPEDWNMGFEEYANHPIPSHLANIIRYQISALENVFSLLSGVQVERVVHVYREPLDEKRVDLFFSTRSKESVLLTPLEITFDCSERAFRKFLSEFLNRKDFLYLIRFLSVENSNTSAPKAIKNLFVKGKSSNLYSKEGKGDSKSVVKNEKILTQILGNEKIRVSLRFDLGIIKKK